MVRADGLVKIVDFGLAKQTDLDKVHTCVGQLAFQTVPGLIVGTPRYMSPEQARGLTVDSRSDLFSLGSVLYEMLAASPAVNGTNLGDILAALLNNEPRPLEKVRPHCPARLVHIVRRALDKDRDKRYQSAEEMLVDLQKVRQDIRGGIARPIRPRSSLKHSGLRWLLASSVAIGTLLIAVARLRFVNHDSMHEVTGILGVTTYPGNESQPSLSPDGREVAFSWEGEKGDNRDIYVITLGQQKPRRLTTDSAEDGYPAWSPDGAQIAFIRHYTNSAEIVVVPAGGGSERHLRKIRLGSWITGRMLAWSPDGKWLCFTNEVATSGNHALLLLSLESGVVRRFSPEKDNGEGDSCPAFSPDGRWLAFVRFHESNSSDVLLQRISHDLRPVGAPLTVAGAGVNPLAPVWTKDGRVLFLEGSRIMRADIGGAARSFYVSPFAFSELTLAGSGRQLRIVASQQNPNEEIWTLALGANGLTATGSQRIVQSTRSETHPRYSPDGRWLAFRSGRSGSPEIWLADADGSNPRQLTHMSAYSVSHPHWSPDGQFIAFDARFPAEPQLYVVRLADGVVRRITSGRPGWSVSSWSSDGKALYACGFVNGETYIYRVAASGGMPKLLWKGGEAAEIRGRKLMLYNKEDEWGIYARPLTGYAEKNPEHLLARDYRPPWGAFSGFEDGFYYVGYRPTGVPRAFRFYAFDTGRSVDIAAAPSNISGGFSVSPDRTRLAFSTRSHEGEDLVQVKIE